MAESLRALATYYKAEPRVTIRVIDNSYGRGQSRPGTLDLFVQSGDPQRLRKQLIQETEKQYAENQISERVYRGSLGGGGLEAGAREDGRRRKEAVTAAGGGDSESQRERPARLARPASDRERASEAALPARPGGGGGARREVSPPSSAGRRVAGQESTLTIPRSSRTYPVRYEVRELSDLQPSHNPFTFEPNPRYGLVNDRDYTNAVNRADVEQAARPGVFDPRLLLSDDPTATNGPPVIDDHNQVLGGNSRTMMLERVFRYHPAESAASASSLWSAPKKLFPAPLRAGRD